VLRAVDGRGPATSLEGALLDALGIAEPIELIPWLYGGEPPIAQVAALAPVVLRAAEADDAAAREIVTRAAQELALAVRAVQRRLALDDAAIVLGGGLLASASVLRQALVPLLGAELVVAPRHPPVVGAALLARAAARKAGTAPEVRARRTSRQDVTEARNPHTGGIDRAEIPEILRLMNAEDASVANVVRGALEPLARAVEAAVASLRHGGRLIYVGAGTSGRLGVLDAA